MMDNIQIGNHRR